MGAKTWMLVYADTDARAALTARPKIDRAATLHLAKKLFPGEKLTLVDEGDLFDTAPADEELYLGCFSDVSVIAAREFGIEYPSRLPQAFLDAGGSGKIYLHAMHSVVDWFAFAVWSSGKLIRSLSLSPNHGILEDIGARLPFEEPYWQGKHPVADDGNQEDYPFAFHPLELGEAALAEFFGYQLEGYDRSARLDPETIPLLIYERSGSM